MGHRPNDYHPDHRAVGQLVQDASYMVTVPFFCPDTPHLEGNPVFISFEDRFTKPNPLTADIVVGIDDVVEKKLDATAAMPSQFYEGGANGGPRLVPSDVAGKTRRKNEVREGSGAGSLRPRRRSRPNCGSYMVRIRANPFNTRRRSRSPNMAVARTPKRSAAFFRFLGVSRKSIGSGVGLMGLNMMEDWRNSP